MILQNNHKEAITLPSISNLMFTSPVWDPVIPPSVGELNKIPTGLSWFSGVTSSFPEKSFEGLNETTTEKLLEPLRTVSHLGFINVSFEKELSCLHLLVEQR